MLTVRCRPWYPSGLPNCVQVLGIDADGRGAKTAHRMCSRWPASPHQRSVGLFSTIQAPSRLFTRQPPRLQGPVVPPQGVPPDLRGPIRQVAEPSVPYITTHLLPVQVMGRSGHISPYDQQISDFSNVVFVRSTSPVIPPFSCLCFDR